jgi:hypothetical protein
MNHNEEEEKLKLKEELRRKKGWRRKFSNKL